jgi:hypothetical protein
MVDDSFVCEIPDGLSSAILNGRCIAFVGAGFSQPAAHDWETLLKELGRQLEVDVHLPKNASALDYELVGQSLRHAAGSDERFEHLVKVILDRPKDEAGRKTVEARCEWLRTIPFKAILTTNYDRWLPTGTDSNDAYWDVLRHDQNRWWEFPIRKGDPHPNVPVLRLHGEANGDPAKAPLVLGRADYRRRVYGDRGYTSFIRAAFAQYTVLFLGVSFTDAYLNELRSETLQFLRDANQQTPWGYATMKLDAQTRHLERLYLSQEGIQILPMAKFEEFDQWLRTLAERTSAQGRLKQLMSTKKVIWLDARPENNELGRELLTACGAEVVSLRHEDELRPEMSDASLLVTQFGYTNGDSRAFRALERMKSWSTRPPVIVFASPDGPVEDNRRDCIRRGAWEYATQWSELFRLVEVLFSRNPGS